MALPWVGFAATCSAWLSSARLGIASIERLWRLVNSAPIAYYRRRSNYYGRGLRKPFYMTARLTHAAYPKARTALGFVVLGERFTDPASQAWQLFCVTWESVIAVYGLFAFGCPSAIRWFVIPVIIDPIYGMFRRWTSPHVGYEVLHGVFPLIAHRYTPPTPFGVPGMFWVQAPGLHLRPRIVFSARGPVDVFTVAESNRAAGEPRQFSATATFFKAISQFTITGCRWRTARADAIPLTATGFSAVGYGARYYGELVKYMASYIWGWSYINPHNGISIA